ncbi:galactoside alpha-(1,2)-fucosyltransferase 2-like [Ambystoma mexicanum]|uniref:galactoside alpha-(1,2)-fucosyltransferase 2-like n=1 Tax=Ambystoma mexicanum TaxID=8296 RepID=UPI0037E901D7
MGVLAQFHPRRVLFVVALLGSITLLSLYINSRETKEYSMPQTCPCDSLAENTPTHTIESKGKGDGMWTVLSVNRLGNQMDGYAALYALAKMHGKQPYIQSKMHGFLSPMFKITIPVLHNTVDQKTKWRGYYLKNWMLEEYKNITGEYIKLMSSPFSWTFFHHLQDEIRTEFALHDFIDANAKQKLQRLKGSRTNVTFVGVHVRRGDYVLHNPRDWKGVLGDKAYLDQAMGYFRKKYQDPIFVVASNGMPWCKENINASKGDVYFAGDSNEASPENDFALLVNCNHTVMTIGSFGWWAGYLAGGEVIYLSNYTGPGSTLPKYLSYKTTYLPEWIGIDADLTPLLDGSWKTWH